jgi:translation elongation factor EF-1alpha
MAEQEIGVVSHYFDKIEVAAIRLTKGSLEVGDTIRVRGRANDFEQMVASMQIEHASVSKAVRGDEIGVKISQPVREHDKVYKTGS